MSEAEKNGVEKKEKKERREKPVVVVDTETELRAHETPKSADGKHSMKMYQVRVMQDLKVGDVLGFTFEFNPAGAVLNVLKKKPVLKAERLGGDLPSWDKVRADMATMLGRGEALPDDLKQLVGVLNQGGQVPPKHHKK